MREGGPPPPSNASPGPASEQKDLLHLHEGRLPHQARHRHVCVPDDVHAEHALAVEDHVEGLVQPVQQVDGLGAGEVRAELRVPHNVREDARDVVEVLGLGDVLVHEGFLGTGKGRGGGRGGGRRQQRDKGTCSYPFHCTCRERAEKHLLPRYVLEEGGGRGFGWDPPPPWVPLWSPPKAGRKILKLKSSWC